VGRPSLRVVATLETEKWDNCNLARMMFSFFFFISSLYFLFCFLSFVSSLCCLGVDEGNSGGSGCRRVAGSGSRMAVRFSQGLGPVIPRVSGNEGFDFCCGFVRNSDAP